MEGSEAQGEPRGPTKAQRGVCPSSRKRKEETDVEVQELEWREVKIPAITGP